MPGTCIRAAALVLCAVIAMLLLPFVPASAQELVPAAEEISDVSLLQDANRQFYRRGLFDGVTAYGYTLKKGAEFSLASEAGIGSLNIVFGKVPGAYTVTDGETGMTRTFGEKGFLHEFVDLEGAFGRAPQSVKLSFPDRDVSIHEISAFTSGQVSDSVQRWEEPVEHETDLILFSAHGDDEQIFFAGLLPYYAGERNLRVQVVYLTDHHNNIPSRIHEMLDGLWAVGVKTYPVIGTYADLYTTSLKDARKEYANRGISEEELLGFVVEQIRRFRPKVAVGHDLAGEYGHGMHMLYADLLCKALAVSDDPACFPELAAEYGLWDVPKTYLHLYETNPVHMNWDIPLDAFDGKTAYEVTRDLGFPCHVSQRSDYSWYFRGSPTAEQVKKYSCCDYGLYRSTVGEDVLKNDFFENLTTYAEDNRMEAELIAAEKARQKALAEEQARAREEAEAAARAEEKRRQDALRQEETRKTEARRTRQEAQEKKRTVAFVVLAGLSAAVLGGAWLFAAGSKKRRK